MTTPANGSRVPGVLLLRIASLLFSERFVSTAVQPTIADLQAEYAAAGESRVHRLRARWNGYCAFWLVALLAPFSPEPVAAAAETRAWSSGISGHFTAGMTVLTLLIFFLTTAGVSMALVVAAGALCAVVIHAWYDRHPIDAAMPRERAWRTPQINFSSTEVPGNIGGLIFMVGSLLVVTLGLPTVLWFLFVAAAAGCFVAWRLAAWRTRHPHWGLPQNRIVLR